MKRAQGLLCALLALTLALVPAVALADEAADSWDDEEAFGAALNDEEDSVEPTDEELAALDQGADIDEALENEGELEAQAASLLCDAVVSRTVNFDEAYTLLALANEQREAKGMTPVTWNAKLEELAVTRATELSLRMAINQHADGSAIDYTKILGEKGYVGERGYAVKASVTDTPMQYCWDSFETLREKELLQENVTHIAAACVKVGTRYYISVLFGSNLDAGESRYGTGKSPTEKATVHVRTSLISLKTVPAVATVSEGEKTTLILVAGLYGTTVPSISGLTWVSGSTATATVTGTSNSVTATGRRAGKATISCQLEKKTITEGAVKVTKPSTGSCFSDVDSSTSHAEDIFWLENQGVTEGWTMSDGTVEFRGEATVVRQDMAAFLYRLAGSPAYEPSATDKARFTDVNANTPHAKEIWWLAKEGISEGYKDKTFRGDQPVKRKDMAAFLHRLAKVMGKTAETPAGYQNPFTDITSKTSHYEDILWLSATGVSEGYKEKGGKKTFRPDLSVKRQDMAAFMHRLYDLA